MTFSMRYCSTKGKGSSASLQEALLQSLAPDGGLYLPESIPQLSASFLAALPEQSLPQIGTEVLKPYLPELEPTELSTIVSESLNFPIPLVQVTDRISILELFHGPTLAFKDVGARFLAHLLQHLLNGEKRELTILVATSGDTGSAVAAGFFAIPGIRVVILYPSGKVSALQEKQLTTMGGNVTALEVDGTFDDCQRLVKDAFADDSLRKCLLLSSANSINIGRLLPQMIYYFWALAQWQTHRSAPTFISVPSGNFGNLTAGVMAKRMGLPVGHFIAATNVNDVMPKFLTTGLFQPRPSVPTIANAMDVGNPSNAERLFHLYQNDLEAMRADITGVSITDKETRATMRQVYQTHHYLLDPHTAVGYAALESMLKKNPSAHGIVLSTAHPAKFLEVVESATGTTVHLPPALQSAMQKPKQSVQIKATIIELKKHLMS